MEITSISSGLTPTTTIAELGFPIAVEQWLTARIKNHKCARRARETRLTIRAYDTEELRRMARSYTVADGVAMCQNWIRQHSSITTKPTCLKIFWQAVYGTPLPAVAKKHKKDRPR